MLLENNVTESHLFEVGDRLAGFAAYVRFEDAIGDWRVFAFGPGDLTLEGISALKPGPWPPSE